MWAGFYVTIHSQPKNTFCQVLLVELTLNEVGKAATHLEQQLELFSLAVVEFSRKDETRASAQFAVLLVDD